MAVRFNYDVHDRLASFCFRFIIHFDESDKAWFFDKDRNEYVEDKKLWFTIIGDIQYEFTRRPPYQGYDAITSLKNHARRFLNDAVDPRPFTDLEGVRFIHSALHEDEFLADPGWRRRMSLIVRFLDTDPPALNKLPI
jgi:hypothetical protein